MWIYMLSITIYQDIIVFLCVVVGHLKNGSGGDCIEASNIFFFDAEQTRASTGTRAKMVA